MKKPTRITIIVLSVLFIIQIPFNIHNNAYYYATHMPHKKSQYPFTTLLNVNYLPPSDVPGYQVKNNDERDVFIVLIRKENLQTKSDIIEVSGHDIIYGTDREKSYYSEDYAKFLLSDSGKLDGFYKDGPQPKNVKSLLRQTLNEVQNKIKINSEKPLINIQWIWNVCFKLNHHD